MNSKLLELKWITKLIINLVLVALLQISDGRENGFANPSKYIFSFYYHRVSNKFILKMFFKTHFMCPYGFIGSI